MMKRKGYVPPEPPKPVKKRKAKAEEKVGDGDPEQAKNQAPKKGRKKKDNADENGEIIKRPTNNQSWQKMNFSNRRKKKKTDADGQPNL